MVARSCICAHCLLAPRARIPRARRFLGRALATLSFATLTLIASSARANLQSGWQKLVHGDYQAAIRDLDSLRGENAAEASVLRARAQMAVGDYAEAAKTASTVQRGPFVLAAAIVRARALRAVGSYAHAIEILEPFAAQNPPSSWVRYELAMTLLRTGQQKRSQKLFAAIYDDYRGRRIDEKNPHELLALAEAGRYLESVQFASGFFRDAVDLDPQFHEANIKWGHLFLLKYNAADAERSFDEVLKINPNHPDAQAGMARVRLEQNYDLAAAEKHIAKALAVNPRHLPSLVVRAELETDKNQWQSAQKTVAEILAVNPEHPSARARLATIYWLIGDMAAYEAEKSKALAIDPMFAEFFHIVARSAEREHRYKQAIRLEKEALKIDPTYYVAMQAIGTGYLRLGKEARGLKWLRRAYKKDPYNVRTINLLDLFEQVIPKSYEFAHSKNFRIRLHKDERAIYQRFIGPLLEKAFASMVERYRFKPKTPIIIELYRDPDHYSVRTVGLPNFGALGVCFGQVITARSPSSGDMNWGMVLWHELGHVFAIQMSQFKVPRWYTEGLAEYETMLARPEWRRENDADLYSALIEKRLPSVTELNYGFMKPNMQEVVEAYYLSAVIIEYIAEQHGFDKIVDGLKLFATGAGSAEVIEKITGRTVAQFDREFRSYLRARLVPYRGTFHLPATGFDDLAALEQATREKPQDANAWAGLALGQFFDGNAALAKKAVTQALTLDASNKIALYIEGELALHSRNAAGAKKAYEALIAAGADGADIRARLGMLAAQSKHYQIAEGHFCTAKMLHPERSLPYQALHDIYQQQGKKAQALKELEHYVYLEQMQYEPLKVLTREHAKLHHWEQVAHFGEMAVLINPADVELLLQMAKAHLELANYQRALYLYDSALVIHPPLRRPSAAHIGRARVLLRLGRRRSAKWALGIALRLEPNNKEALLLRRTLR